MPNWIFESEGGGDKSSLIRAAWYSGFSNIRMLEAIQQPKDRYDDAEGWAPRINYGTVPQNFAGSLGSNSGGAPNPTMTAVVGNPTLRTKSNGSADSAITSGFRQILQIINREGATGNEVFTNHYSGSPTINMTNLGINNQTWYISMYVREGYQAGYHDPRVTLWLFGTGLNAALVYTYQVTNYNIVSGGTEASPSVGSAHYKQVTLDGATWIKIEMYCTFNNSNVSNLSCRIDLDDGRSGGDTRVLIDRMQLIPLSGIGLDKNLGGTNPDSLNDVWKGTYAT